MDRNVIVNADDFGASAGINRAIRECHVRGVVTSASLMVFGKAANEAAAMMNAMPALSVGLHFDVLGESLTEDIDLTDHAAMRTAFDAQLAEFERLTGRRPTHVDSHRHAHHRAGLFPVFEERVTLLGIPLRGDGRVRFAGGFYGQPEWLVTDLAYVSPSAFLEIASEHALPGWLEIGCHPGFVSPEFESVYMTEREEEVNTLTNPALRASLNELGIRLSSYHDFQKSGVRT